MRAHAGEGKDEMRTGPLPAAEDGLESVLGPPLARFWCHWGPFGVCFGIRKPDFDN